jgi:hypothetical protein
MGDACDADTRRHSAQTNRLPVIHPCGRCMVRLSAGLCRNPIREDQHRQAQLPVYRLNQPLEPGVK